MLVFSLGSVVGIGSGMAIADQGDKLTHALPVMQVSIIIL